jgi:hypothetical protein
LQSAEACQPEFVKLPQLARIGSVLGLCGAQI